MIPMMYIAFKNRLSDSDCNKFKKKYTKIINNITHKY